MDKLKGNSSAIKKTITNDIFGYQVGHQEIVDASSEEEFDTELMLLKEKLERYIGGFHDWFQTCQVERDSHAITPSLTLTH